MKKMITLLLLSLAVLSGCQKEDEVAPVPVTQILNGSYQGQITYYARGWTGTADTSYISDVHALKFEINSDKFARPECGCAGTISIDSTSRTALLTSPDKACADNGSNGESSWSFTNDIIGNFTYHISGDTLTLTETYPAKIGALTPFEKKVIVATR